MLLIFWYLFDPNSQILSLMFSSGSFVVLSFTFKSMICFELFLYDTRYEFKSMFLFISGRPIVLAPFVEMTVLSPLNYLCIFVKMLVIPICMDSFQDSLS